MLNKSKISVGVEVNDRYVRILKLSEINGEITVDKVNEVSLSPGIVERGMVINPLELLLKFSEVFGKTEKPSEIQFSLPDELVYTHIFRAEVGSEKEFRQVIENECIKNIPLLYSELEISYKIIKEDDGNTKQPVSKIILAAVFKKALQNWQNFFEKQNIKVNFFDIEALAVYRGLYKKYTNKRVGVLHIKEYYSKFSIFSSSGLEYEYSSSIGLEKIFGKSKLEFEKNDNVALLVAELKKNIDYNRDLKNNKGLEEIVLCGEGGNIGKLQKYLEKQLGDYKFQLGSCVISSSSTTGNYIQALGSALRPLDDDWENNDPIFGEIKNRQNLEEKIQKKEQMLLDGIVSHKKLIILLLVVAGLAFSIWQIIYFLSKEAESQSYIESNLPIQIIETGVASSTEQKELSFEDSVKKQTVEEDKVALAPVKIEKRYVKINNIAGTLNVRQEPGLSFKAIDKVKSGAEYVLLEEKDGWYKIEIAVNKSGWINSSFASKK